MPKDIFILTEKISRQVSKSLKSDSQSNLWAFLLSAVMIFGLYACSPSASPDLNIEHHGRPSQPTPELIDYTKKNAAKIDSMNQELIAAHSDLQTDSLLAQSATQDEFLDLDMTFWVNKEFNLSKNFAPKDLEVLDPPYCLGGGANRLRKAAKAAFISMVDYAAKYSDIKIGMLSGYRSWYTQESTFKYWVSAHGQEMAERESAWPGHSEHQLGTVLDVTTPELGGNPFDGFGTSKEGLWLKDNAHYFGFVISYQEKTETITGYMYEPWHIRYVGRPIAERIYKNAQVTEQLMQELHNPPTLLVGFGSASECAKRQFNNRAYWTCKGKDEVRRCSLDQKDIAVYKCTLGCYSCAQGEHDFCADDAFSAIIAAERKCTLIDRDVPPPQVTPTNTNQQNNKTTETRDNSGQAKQKNG